MSHWHFFWSETAVGCLGPDSCCLIYLVIWRCCNYPLVWSFTLACTGCWLGHFPYDKCGDDPKLLTWFKEVAQPPSACVNYPWSTIKHCSPCFYSWVTGIVNTSLSILTQLLTMCLSILNQVFIHSEPLYIDHVFSCVLCVFIRFMNHSSLPRLFFDGFSPFRSPLAHWTCWLRLAWSLRSNDRNRNRWKSPTSMDLMCLRPLSMSGSSMMVPCFGYFRCIFSVSFCVFLIVWIAYKLVFQTVASPYFSKQQLFSWIDIPRRPYGIPEANTMGHHYQARTHSHESLCLG